MNIGIIAGSISLFAYGLYIYKIWWGQTRPSRSSWWILSVVWFVVLMSSVSVGTDGDFNRLDAYLDRGLQVAYVIGSLIIAVSTIWKGSPDKWGIWDWACAILAIIALVIFLTTKHHFVSLVFGIMADFVGIVPTVRNAKRWPQHEDFIAWSIECFASFLGLFAVSTWALTSASAGEFMPPIYLLIFNSIITYFIWSGRRKISVNLTS